MQERLVCESADFPLRVAAAFAAALGLSADWTMFLATDDMEAAYRRLACAQPSFTIVAQWDPVRRRVAFFRVQGFNFGLVSAVVQYNALAEMLTRAAVRLIPVVTCHYFDDWACPEPDFCGNSGPDALARLFSLAGFPLARGQPRLQRSGGQRLDSGGRPMFYKDKQAKAGLSTTFLGVLYDFALFRGTGKVFTSVADSKLKSVREMVASVLSTKVLPFAVAARLAGKLRYCTTWAVGRFGRALLQPIYVRANHRRAWGRRAAALSTPLLNSLRFFGRMFAQELKRVISVDPSARARPALVWTDAMWSAAASEPARIGLVVHLPAVLAPDLTMISPARWLYSHGPVPGETMARMADREQYITQLEVMAAVAAYLTFAEELARLDVIHWIDNTGALAVMAKAYSTEIDISKMLHEFETANLLIRCIPYFEYVRSAANIADLPSRGDLDYLHQLEAAYAPMVLPDLKGWSELPRNTARKRKRARRGKSGE